MSRAVAARPDARAPNVRPRRLASFAERRRFVEIGDFRPPRAALLGLAYRDRGDVPARSLSHAGVPVPTRFAADSVAATMIRRKWGREHDDHVGPLWTPDCRQRCRTVASPPP